MGLRAGQVPTDQAINASSIFAHIAAQDEVLYPRDVSPEMIQALKDAGCLAMTRYEKLGMPDDIKIAIYTWDVIKAIYPEIMEANKGSKPEDDPRLVIVIPPMATNVCFTYGYDELFTISCLKQQTIKVDKHSKQIAFCAFCGMHGSNFESSLSHIRRHLGLHFVCGSCFGVHFLKPDKINSCRVQFQNIGNSSISLSASSKIYYPHFLCHKNVVSTHSTHSTQNTVYVVLF